MHGLIGSKVTSSGRHGRRKFIWTQADLLDVRGAAFGYLQRHYHPDLGPGLSAADRGHLGPYLDPELTSSWTARNEIHIHVRGYPRRAWRLPAWRGAARGLKSKDLEAAYSQTVGGFPSVRCRRYGLIHAAGG